MFYVAITRAKKGVYIFTRDYKQSEDAMVDGEGIIKPVQRWDKIGKYIQPKDVQEETMQNQYLA